MKRVRATATASERRFRGARLCAPSIACRCCSSPSCCSPWRSKGIGGFTHYEAALPIDFAKSTCSSTRRRLHGPDAAADRGRGRSRSGDLEGRGRGLWAGRRARCSAMRRLDDLDRRIVANPDMLDRPRRLCGFRSAARSISPPRTTATRRVEKLVSAAPAEACASPELQLRLPDGVRLRPTRRRSASGARSRARS